MKKLYDLLAEKGIAPVDLARALGVHRGNVSHWHDKRVPAERVLDVERVTGISRYLLRPDIYPVSDFLPPAGLTSPAVPSPGANAGGFSPVAAPGDGSSGVAVPHRVLAG